MPLHETLYIPLSACQRGGEGTCHLRYLRGARAAMK